jgi:hypothetical protein
MEGEEVLHPLHSIFDCSKVSKVMEADKEG